MAIETARTILTNAAGVTALVGLRVSPLIRSQDESLPCVVLTLTSVSPMNHLDGPATLEANRLIVDSFATTYDAALEVADACRTALEAADVIYQNQSDVFEPGVSEYRVSREFLLWT